MADSKAVRRYAAGVERALALFDSSNEWADYIAFLSRLLRSLQEPPPEVDIPFKKTIARHLAQCLKPSLPAGVHQKALEVYGLMFSIIGPQGLSQDLSLYLPGLSHTLAFASLATRPYVLALYDEHILAVSPRVLRPALRALILSLLPAIEEESSEDFERTLDTFSRLQTMFSKDGHEEIFWQNLFLASITSPHRRAGVLVYLARFLPKLRGKPSVEEKPNGQTVQDDTSPLTNPEPGLLVRCFATGLLDEQPLIRRGFLDMLVSHLPLDAYIFSAGRHNNDLDVLVSAAATVVLRRDMGLNRRLWAWFIGSDIKIASLSEAEAEDSSVIASPVVPKTEKRNLEYFTQHGLQPLIRSIRGMLSNPGEEPSVHARPFRVALSLMDRWEIGGPVVESVFVPLIKGLQLYQSTAPSQDAFDEVFRSANVFFDGVEGRLITSQMITLLQQEDFDIILFIVTNFNLEDDEMTKRHVPLICLFVASKIRGVLRSDLEQSNVESRTSTLASLTRILRELLDLVVGEALDDTDPVFDTTIMDSWQASVLRFYELGTQSTKSIMAPLTRSALTAILVQNVCESFLHCLSDSQTDITILPVLASCLEKCITSIQGYVTLKRINFVHELTNHLKPFPTDERHLFQLSTSIAKMVVSLGISDTMQQALTEDALCNLIPCLIESLWALLQPSSPQYHVEVVEYIWRLHNLTHDLSLVESTILRLLAAEDALGQSSSHTVLRFSALWTHSRSASKQVLGTRSGHQITQNDGLLELLGSSILSLIDTIDDSDPNDPVCIWLRSLTSLEPMFAVVFTQLHASTNDEQIMGVGLQRLISLIRVCNSSKALRASFIEQQDQSSAVLALSSAIVSANTFVKEIGVSALHMVRLIVEDGGLELDSNFIELLTTRLATTHQDTEFQLALLDTFQTVFSQSGENNLTQTILPVLLDGLALQATDPQIDKWVALLCNIVPILPASMLMANLLKITSCMCKRVELYFNAFQTLYGNPTQAANGSPPSTTVFAHPERSISNLLAGMEYLLARAHQATVTSDRKSNNLNSSSSDLPSSRSTANDHLTIVLCMQDALKSCAMLWLWRSTARTKGSHMDAKSLHYMSSKLRTKSRRILENLIEAEPQECLETMMSLWVERCKSNGQHGQVLELLQTLDGARPKFMMPATFNAIYNRTNPAALDHSQRSSLSVDLNAFELIAFLNQYTHALEDDLLDEIWADCTTFLREILANPLPHRQILLKLLEFTAVLCRKMENTNFGEEVRMRKELADICTRLFTAIFTIKPYGLDGSSNKASELDNGLNHKISSSQMQLRQGNALQILYETLPDLSIVLGQSDRLPAVYSGIATNMTGPILRSKLFPANVSLELLALIQAMSSTPSATKTWRKDILDAFNDSKFFQTTVSLVGEGWLPLIRQLVVIDKSVVQELLLRILPPATAGLMFGVGATAARTEADRKMQAALRRLSLVLLSTETDSLIPYLQPLLNKIEELLTATPESSPSSSTRSDIYILMRAILLSYSQSQLASLWPIIDNELRDLCDDMVNGGTAEPSKFTPSARLQGAKVLDLLLLMKPDEFQLHEWLFVTDTMDAIYPPVDLPPVALADQIAAVVSGEQVEPPRTPAPAADAPRKPWLCSEESRDPERLNGLLGTFFSQLSIRVFEDNYSLQRIDLEACRKDLIEDLFVEGQ